MTCIRSTVSAYVTFTYLSYLQVGSSSNLLSKKVKQPAVQPQAVRKPLGPERSDQQPFAL